MFCFISIHLMLRFNNMVSSGQAFLKVFQYILCYGSTVFISAIGVQFLYFNTSYVTVQQECKNSTTSQCGISIHLMLRFNRIVPFRFDYADWFQYILCYGSTSIIIPSYLTSDISIHLMLRFNNQQISEEHVHAKFQYILCYGSTLY